MIEDGSKEDNQRKAMEYCRQARKAGADIALMAEMWNMGYRSFDPKVEGAKEAFYNLAQPTTGEWVHSFSRLARELNMAIGVTYMQTWKTCPLNAMTLFDRHGKEVFTYAKVHTCDFSCMEGSLPVKTGMSVS
jgi:predicted amidohydrolase